MVLLRFIKKADGAHKLRRGYVTFEADNRCWDEFSDEPAIEILSRKALAVFSLKRRLSVWKFVSYTNVPPPDLKAFTWLPLSVVSLFVRIRHSKISATSYDSSYSLFTVL